jgi:hypothetical protein
MDIKLLKDIPPGVSADKMFVVTDQADGAFPNGTKVKKINSDQTDSHQDGATATILGSVGPVLYHGKQTYGYWLRWDDSPLPCFINSTRIERVET